MTKVPVKIREECDTKDVRDLYREAHGPGLLKHLDDSLVTSVKLPAGEYVHEVTNPTSASQQDQESGYSVEAMEDFTLGNKLLDIALPILPGSKILPYAGHFPQLFDVSKYNATIVGHVRFWMESLPKAGENGLIARNDALFDLMHKMAGLTGISRDKHEMSTVLTTRYDRTDSYGGVPFCMVEEKPGKGVLNAIQDLLRKFCWIPHFHKLPYVFGIVMDENEAVFGKLARDGKFHIFKRCILTIPLQKMECITIVLKMASVIKYFIENGYCIPAEIGVGQWEERNGKEIRIGLKFVETRYNSNNDRKTLYTFLKSMYENTQDVPFKERLFHIRC